MTHFVYDETSLYFPKTDFVPVPSGLAGKYLSAAEWNTICQAVVDARDVLENAKSLGFGAQASKPSLGYAAQLWVKTDGSLNFTRPDGNNVPLAQFSVFNVRSYGATGDGVTDDTVAIQAAIAAVPSYGGTIYFPAGSYIVSQASGHLWIPVAGSRITFQGEGGATSIIKNITGSTRLSYMFQLAGGNCTFRDLGFDTNAPSGVNYISAVTSLSTAGNASILNCRFINTQGSPGRTDPCIILTASRSRVIGNLVETGGGINIGGQGSTVDGAVVVGNIVNVSHEMGISVVFGGIDGTGGQNIVIADNVINGCTDTGIYIGTDDATDTTDTHFKRCVVIGNIVTNFGGTQGIFLRGCKTTEDVTINANVVYGGASPPGNSTGILCLPRNDSPLGKGISVTNNKIRSCDLYAIEVQGGAGVLIQGNDYDLTRGINVSATSTAPVKGARVKDNRGVASARSGILLDCQSGTLEVAVEGNRLSAGYLDGFNDVGAIRLNPAGGTLKARIKNNVTTDDAAGTQMYGLLVIAGAGTCVVTAEDNDFADSTVSGFAVTNGATVPGTQTGITLRKNKGILNWATLTDASPIVVDATRALKFKTTLDHTVGTRQLGAPSGLTEGDRVVVYLIQDSTGGAAVTYNAIWQFSGTAPLNTLAANAKDVIVGEYDGTKIVCTFSPDVQ